MVDWIHRGHRIEFCCFFDSYSSTIEVKSPRVSRSKSDSQTRTDLSSSVERKKKLNRQMSLQKSMEVEKVLGKKTEKSQLVQEEKAEKGNV